MAKNKKDPFFGHATTGPKKSIVPICPGCYYWRATSGVVTDGEHCCHYYLDNGIGHRRRGNEKVCESYKPRKRKTKEA